MNVEELTPGLEAHVPRTSPDDQDIWIVVDAIKESDGSVEVDGRVLGTLGHPTSTGFILPIGTDVETR
jgi:hypothetical protein